MTNQTFGIGVWREETEKAADAFKDTYEHRRDLFVRFVVIIVYKV